MYHNRVGLIYFPPHKYANLTDAIGLKQSQNRRLLTNLTEVHSCSS